MAVKRIRGQAAFYIKDLFPGLVLWMRRLIFRHYRTGVGAASSSSIWATRSIITRWHSWCRMWEEEELVLTSYPTTPPNSAPSPLPKCPTPASITNNNSYNTQIQTSRQSPTSTQPPSKFTRPTTVNSPKPNQKSRRLQWLPRASIQTITAATIRSLAALGRPVKLCKGRRRSRRRKKRRCRWRTSSSSSMIVARLGSGETGLYRVVPGMLMLPCRMTVWRGRMISLAMVLKMSIAVRRLSHLIKKYRRTQTMACPMPKTVDLSKNKIFPDLVEIIILAMEPQMDLLLSVVIPIKFTVTRLTELKVVLNKEIVVEICLSRLSSIKKSTRRRCLRFRVWVNELPRAHLFMEIALISSKIMPICRTLWIHSKWVWVRGRALKARISLRGILNFSSKVCRERDLTNWMSHMELRMMPMLLTTHLNRENNLKKYQIKLKTLRKSN